jgi:hypothetical protein
MNIRYRIPNYFLQAEIEAIEIVEETKKFLVLPDGRREAKTSRNCEYHNTWAEAHAALLKKAEAQVAQVRHRLQEANGLLGNVKGMKPRH